MIGTVNTPSLRNYDPKTVNFFKKSGRATVFSILENTSQAITIEKTNQKGAHLELKAYADIFNPLFKGIRKTFLGSIRLDWLRNFDDGTYGSEQFGDIMTHNDYYYYNSAKKVNKIMVAFIESPLNTKYKGIGTALMQAAMEYGYANQCDGSIHLSATWNSHGFYYKLGMSTGYEDLDNDIADNTTKGKRKDLGSQMMYMPEEGKLKWREKIRTHPVFLETLQYLPTGT